LHHGVTEDTEEARRKPKKIFTADAETLRKAFWVGERLRRACYVVVLRARRKRREDVE
jgi:hypothetical protein